MALNRSFNRFIAPMAWLAPLCTGAVTLGCYVAGEPAECCRPPVEDCWLGAIYWACGSSSGIIVVSTVWPAIPPEQGNLYAAINDSTPCTKQKEACGEDPNECVPVGDPASSNCQDMVPAGPDCEVEN